MQPTPSESLGATSAGRAAPDLVGRVAGSLARGCAERSAIVASAAYLVLAVAASWPLARGLARDLPQDLGDPVLNTWILSWVTDRLRLALSGAPSALAGFWNANIFYPEPRALAYSEHLLAQSVQILPLRWLGAGPVLCHNLLFLESYVLSGLGMFLLARDLTGSRRAAFVAGLLFGFAPYRADQLGHVQVLTSQWMPFALLGLRRFVTRGSAFALLGAAAALTAQALSCGYHLLFFLPFGAAWAAHQLLAGDRWRDGRRWLGLALDGAAVATVVVPVMLPYVEVRRAGAILRSGSEVELYSADVYAYLTAPQTLRFWGEQLRLAPGPESSLFPGLVPAGLGLLGAAAVVRRAWSRRPAAARPSGRVRGALAVAAATALALALTALAVQLLAAGFWPAVPSRGAPSLLLGAGLSGIVLLLAAPRLRAIACACARSSEGFAAAAVLLAAWLSLGPVVRTLGQEMPGLGLYGWLYAHVPGFDGVRVPARYATVVVLFLALLAARGALAVLRRGGPWTLAGLAVLFLLESTAAPIPVNGLWSERQLEPPPDHLLLGAELPAIYRDAMRLPADSVLLEFPFGSDPYELRYMASSMEHRLRLVNGMSGAVPKRYEALRGVLRDVLRRPDDAWEALRQSEATHVVVHESAFRGHRGRRVTSWLSAHGLREVARRGPDVLLALP